MVVANRRHGTVVADQPGVELGARARTAHLRAAADQYALAARQLGTGDDAAVAALRAALARLGDHVT
jgi:hypothetical protein